MAGAQPLPKYIQISERLIREIAAGHIADGARLPPERDMAADLGIAVGTLRKALGDLEAKGLLERIQGSGNYVRHKPGVESVYAFFRLERVQGGGLPTAEVLSVDRLPKPEGPRFGPNAEGHRIRRLRRLDDDVIALEEIWLDGGWKDVITRDDLSDSLYLYYRETLGLVIASVEDRIGVAAVPAWADARFDPAPGAAVGYIERVSRTSEGSAEEYSRTWFDIDKARYVSRMGKG
jgi:GntR family transcriptional regulator